MERDACYTRNRSQRLTGTISEGKRAEFRSPVPRSEAVEGVAGNRGEASPQGIRTLVTGRGEGPCLVCITSFIDGADYVRARPAAAGGFECRDLLRDRVSASPPAPRRN
jgi:hypothetical protein